MRKGECDARRRGGRSARVTLVTKGSGLGGGEGEDLCREALSNYSSSGVLKSPTQSQSQWSEVINVLIIEYLL